MKYIRLEDVFGVIDRLEGDVRDLKVALERACAPGDERPAAAPVPLEDIEREHIVEVLRQTNGNRMAAARALGISRRSLYRRLERHHIDALARPSHLHRAS